MWASKAAARLENLCCMASAELAAALLSGVVGVDGLATVCSAGAWFSRLLVTVGARAGAIGATGITAVAVSSLATASHMPQSVRHGSPTSDPSPMRGLTVFGVNLS